MSNYILISTSIFCHQLPDPSSLGCIPVPRCLGSSCLENLNLQLIRSHWSIHKSILALIGHLIRILSCDWLTHLDIIFIMTRSGEVFAHNKLFRFLINLLQHTLDHQSINQLSLYLIKPGVSCPVSWLCLLQTSCHTCHSGCRRPHNLIDSSLWDERSSRRSMINVTKIILFRCILLVNDLIFDVYFLKFKNFIFLGSLHM